MNARFVAACLGAVCLAGWCSGARADEPPGVGAELDRKRACIAAHEGVQRARRAGSFRDARDESAVCADAGCPAVIRDECASWSRELERDQPSVVLAARDSMGRRLDGVSVHEDSALLAQRLDGRALEIEPGAHRYRFTHGSVTVEVRSTVRLGDKNKLVQAVFPAPPPAPARVRFPPHADTRTRGVPTESWILGGVAALGLASATYFGLSGLSRQRDMEASCAPRCPGSDVDAMQRRYLVADVSLGVAILSAAGAVWFAVGPSRTERPE